LRIRQFLSFANKEAEKGIGILTQRFLDHLRQKEHLSDGLIQQADDALRLYLHYEEGIKSKEGACARDSETCLFIGYRHIKRDETPHKT